MKNDIDSLGIGKALELFPDQIRNNFDQAYSSNIPTIECSSVLITGMGGSSNAGKILESLVQKDYNKPFVVHNDYDLPGWVNKDTLVVANSYSGNTEETLSGITEAKKRGSKILGVATGGKIGEMIKSGEIPGAVVTPGETNPSGYPKSGLGVSLGALTGSLIKAGVLPFTKDHVFEAVADLESIRKDWNVAGDAKWFTDSIPVIFSGRPFLGPLNAGRNAMCEISRVFSLFFDFPEVNHVLIEATQKPDFVKEKIKYLFFKSSLLHPRVLTRFEITQKIFNEQGLSYNNFELKGKTLLSQALELPHYCAWLGFHMSILRNEDPGPEPWIIKLKEALSQPVH